MTRANQLAPKSPSKLRWDTLLAVMRDFNNNMHYKEVTYYLPWLKSYA